MKRSKTNSDDRKLMDQLIVDPSYGRLLGILATTYEMQPEFFETDFLPTLLGLGAWDDRSWTSRIALEKQLAELEAATVMQDAGPYRGRPRSLHVEVTPVPLGVHRALHAKVLIGVYDKAVRLIVGSANLTEFGYRRNREVGAVLTASDKRPGESRLITEAIRAMERLTAPWATASGRCVQMLALERLDGWASEDGGVDQWFAWSGGDQPLWRQFLERWPATDQIERITIVSPFWSEEHDDGPITTFVAAIRERACLGTHAGLFLLTEAEPDQQTSYKPKLPESFGHFDCRALGIHAKAQAVDPRVPPEEVGLSDDIVGTPGLHAKVVLLAPSETEPERLDLVITTAETVAAAWSVAHLPTDDASRHVLLTVEQPEPGSRSYRTPLSDEALARLLREQEVHVVWWQCADGRPFPLNVSSPGRTALPVRPGTGRPEEQHLIAYYQGRITWEDLFPEPGDGNAPAAGAPDETEPSGVDTSCIQSYIVREFVEALRGIRDDLRAAAMSSKACMRVALLGSVSPLALSRRIFDAAAIGTRTVTASGFQFVEILACLDEARGFETSPRCQQDWTGLVDEAAAKVAAMLDTLQQRFPEDLSRGFQRYANTVRQHYLARANKR